MAKETGIQLSDKELATINKQALTAINQIAKNPTEETIEEVVASSSSNAVHILYKHFINIGVAVEKVVKKALMARIDEAVENGGSKDLITTIGKVVKVTTNTISYDAETVADILTDYPDDYNEEDLFNISYSVVSTNKKVLERLVKEGHITKVRTPKKDYLEDLYNKEQSLDKKGKVKFTPIGKILASSREVKTTSYLKGL